jgi:hypothetical protein
VWRIARDSAKVEGQVRLLARTLELVTLEPDGTATACKAVSSGFDSHRRLDRSTAGSDYIVEKRCPNQNFVERSLCVPN